MEIENYHPDPKKNYKQTNFKQFKERPIRNTSLLTVDIQRYVSTVYVMLKYDRRCRIK